jgi:Family of unknown function (DUF5681)
MTDDKRDRGDGRDKNGRWVNVSGNPSGRPKKIPDLDMADILNFSMKTIKIKIGGEEQVVTHHEALVHALYQNAMKGRIPAQRYLLEKFEQAALTHEFIWARYEEYADALATDPDSVPDDVKRLMRMIEASADRPRSSVRRTTPPKRKKKGS